MAGGLDGTAQRDAGADADVHRALHALVLQHEAAEVAFWVESHPHLGDVVDVGVGLAGKVIFEHLRLAAALDGGDAPVLDMADHRLLQHADADIGDAGVGDDDAVGGALQRGDVGLDGGDGGKFARLHHAVQRVAAAALGGIGQVGAVTAGQADRLGALQRLGDRPAGGGDGREVGLDAAAHQHLLGEVGEHQPACALCHRLLDRLGVGDGFAHHAQKDVGGLHRRRCGGWRLLSVPLAGQDAAEDRLAARRADRRAQLLGDAHAGRLGDNQHRFPRFYPGAAVDHRVRALCHLDVPHKSSLRFCGLDQNEVTPIIGRAPCSVNHPPTLDAGRGEGKNWGRLSFLGLSFW